MTDKFVFGDVRYWCVNGSLIIGVPSKGSRSRFLISKYAVFINNKQT